MTIYLGFDVGTKTIGFAISDRLGMTASPLETIRRGKWSKDAERIAAIITEYEISHCVVGLPRNMDGTEGQRAQSTRAFARNLSNITDAPIAFWDERMSSQAVERMMIEADLSRAKRAQHVDKLAATYILQGYLNSQPR